MTDADLDALLDVFAADFADTDRASLRAEVRGALRPYLATIEARTYALDTREFEKDSAYDAENLAAVVANLESISENVSSLGLTIDRTSGIGSPFTDIAIDLAGPDPGDESLDAAVDFLMSFLRRAELLGREAERIRRAALSTMPEKRGRGRPTKQSALYRFIRALFEIWEARTGEKVKWYWDEESPDHPIPIRNSMVFVERLVRAVDPDAVKDLPSITRTIIYPKKPAGR